MNAVSIERHAGIALLCAADGTVLRILSDRLGARRCISAGEPLAALFDSASRTKSEEFFRRLREHGSAFGWELNVPCGAETSIVPTHFAGVRFTNSAAGSDDEAAFLIVGARTRFGIFDFFEETAALEPAATEQARRAFAEISAFLREQFERDYFQYDELSRLNNELATVQRELAKKNFQLARLNEQKNEFLGIAAHDLRNPLEVVMTYSQFLLEDAAPVLSEEQIGFVKKIYSSSSFMLDLVNDFLDFSKIEAGRLALDKSPVDLPELVRAAAERARVLAEKKGIRVILDESETVPPAVLDAPKIEQVLNNLLGNAVKFSPAGGIVTVGVRRQDARVVVSVRDEGTGIAESEAKMLFQPFAGGKQAPGGEKSTGLGLAIVKKIVEAHGGEISLETEIGAGTTVYVSLPDEPPRGNQSGRKED